MLALKSTNELFFFGYVLLLHTFYPATGVQRENFGRDRFFDDLSLCIEIIKNGVVVWELLLLAVLVERILEIGKFIRTILGTVFVFEFDLHFCTLFYFV